MARKHLTRKEIREDRIKNVLEDVYEGLAGNAKLIAGTVLVLAVAFAAVYAWQLYSASRDDEIQRRFADALEIYHAPVNSDPLPEEAPEPKHQFETEQQRDQQAAQAFQELADEYRGARIGLYARYYLALTYSRMGDYEKAESELKALAADTVEPELTSLALNHLAYVSQLQGKTQQAIETWRKMLETSNSNFPRDGILLNLAKAYEEDGEKEKALEHYRKLSAEFPQSPNSREVNSQIELLEAQLAAAESAPQAEKPETDSGA